MLKINQEKRFNIILPNTNRALQEVLQSASKPELEKLSLGKDINSLLNSLLKQSAQNPAQDKLLLKLLQNNPTLKNLGATTTTLKELLQILQKEKSPLPIEKSLQTFMSDIKDISEKGLEKKVENSGLFLENKLKNLPQNPQMMQSKIKELMSEDFKAVLLKAHEELSVSSSPNKQEILKHIDKLTLQIDYHQLLSHLYDTSSLYIPYSWDALKEGTINIKKSENEKFFTDIDLELKEYGRLFLRLGMFQKNQLSINIKAESQELKNLLQESMPLLRKQLLDAGIEPKEIRFLESEQREYGEEEKSISLGFEVKA